MTVQRSHARHRPELGLNPTPHGTHSMRRTQVTHIYRKTDNMRASQLLLAPQEGQHHSLRASNWKTLAIAEAEEI